MTGERAHFRTATDANLGTYYGGLFEVSTDYRAASAFHLWLSPGVHVGSRGTGCPTDGFALQAVSE
jgi:hypothetical protein